MLTEKVNQYSFVVDRKASKKDIRRAIEEMYEVKVDSVNTLIMPSKSKSRNTKRGAVKGSVSSYKKAIITVADGAAIDFFGEI